jgi:hypothetical protein
MRHTEGTGKKPILETFLEREQDIFADPMILGQIIPKSKTPKSRNPGSQTRTSPSNRNLSDSQGSLPQRRNATVKLIKTHRWQQP